MRESFLELVGELAGVAAETVAMLVVTTVGLFAEVAGFTRALATVDELARWYVGMGAIALYAGLYVLGYRTVLPAVRG